MFTGDTISVTALLERIFRSSAYTKNMNINDAVEFVGQAISLIGVPTSYTEKVTNGDLRDGYPYPIKIKGFKGRLPPDLHKIIQTRTFKDKLPMRYATDTFHKGLHCEGSPDISCNSQHTYKVETGKIIKTSFEEGEVEMAYLAFATDECGMPLIPSEERYVKGIETFVKMKFYEPLWELGIVPDKVFARVEQEYLWYIGSAHNYAIMENIDQFVNTANYMVSLIPNLYHSNSFFKFLGEPEVRWNNNSSELWNR